MPLFDLFHKEGAFIHLVSTPIFSAAQPAQKKQGRRPLPAPLN
jgi:hypothetical protein